MNDQTRQLLVRFYGRFVLAEPSNGSGDLTVLAINPRANPDVQPAGVHHAFMTLSEQQVDMNRVRQAPKPNDPATYRMMANVDPLQATHLMWSLEGCDVDIPIAGGFRWDAGAKETVADLAQLSSRSTLNQDCRTHPGGPTTAIVRLHAGEASSCELTSATIEYDYVKFGAPANPVAHGGILADMVQVRMPFPTDGLTITVKSTNGNEPVISIPAMAVPPPAPPVIISFSNLCSTSHTGPDAEFAGYYEILQPKPPVPERLIPAVKPSSAIRTRPYGDCFLMARVSY